MESTLIEYLYKSDLKNALVLIKNGIDVNKEINGFLPIISAINSENPKTLQFIIDYGADVNINFGKPLYEIIDLCIDVMIQNELSDFSVEDKTMLKILINNNANIFIKDENDKSPFELINDYSAGNKEYFMYLVKLFSEIIPEIYDIVEFKIY